MEGKRESKKRVNVDEVPKEESINTKVATNLSSQVDELICYVCLLLKRVLISHTCAELYGRLENIMKLFSCRKCTRVASAYVCVCNQTVPEYIVLLRYFFTEAEKISKLKHVV